MEVRDDTFLAAVLRAGVVRVGMVADSKGDLIARTVDLVSDQLAVADPDELLRAVLEREKLMSTGVGMGIALPHAKTDAVTETVSALVVTERPVDFDSVDQQPVRIVFLLVGPRRSDSRHVRILSRFSRLMNRPEVREKLLTARSADAVIDVVLDAEAHLADM